ncbi:hypothetical protein V7128_15810 [Neobacillus vireti]|uniref:hypothetical protein n=1 Tax=Neobacillus vireti TaxID=220686 RepID=UPI003000B51F
MKKRMGVWLIGAMLLFAFPGMAAASWKFEGGHWHYYERGILKTSWLFDNHHWYYLDQAGNMKTGWVHDGSHWYYMNQSGVMQTGWLFTGGHWYYLDKTGAMKTGWLSEGGHWYYLDKSGAMKTGWALVSGKWYHLDKSGRMQTGWLKDGSETYYLDGSGAMATGWKDLSGNRYYFGLDTGAMVRQNFVNGYYLMADGRLTNAGNAAIVSVVNSLKNSVDVGMTQEQVKAQLGSAYQDLIGIEGEKYWLYTIKVTDADHYGAVNVNGSAEFGAEELAKGLTDIIALVYWDKDGKAFQVTMDYFNEAHKFHNYRHYRWDHEYN